ncbi:MAG: RHS repeat-associated core domain-containing protein [Saprospiraceae bacterium]|nr:RHS repeat-associated core domain-containing protein [Saprospiraceae bacterium]
MNLPFGETMGEQFALSPNAWCKTPYLFNGKELDSKTSLYYYGARYYDPGLSVWLSVDPLAEKYAAWTPYNYTMQNPLKYTDPTGLEIVIPFKQSVYGNRDEHDHYANQFVLALNKYSNDEYRFNKVTKQIEIASRGTQNSGKDYSANTERIAKLIAPNELGTKTFIEKGEDNYTVPEFFTAASNPEKGSDATIYWNPEKEVKFHCKMDQPRMEIPSDLRTMSLSMLSFLTLA